MKEEIEKIDIQLSSDPNNTNLLDLLNDKKSQLTNILDEKTSGIILRAKAEWVEGAERNTQYFSNLEKKRAESKTINRLKCKNNEITNSRDILKETEAFYKELYCKRETMDCNLNLFNNLNKNELNDNQKESSNGFLTECEFKLALKETTNYKSPGSNGISLSISIPERNKTFYIESINYSYRH